MHIIYEESYKLACQEMLSTKHNSLWSLDSVRGTYNRCHFIHKSRRIRFTPMNWILDMFDTLFSTLFQYLFMHWSVNTDVGVTWLHKINANHFMCVHKKWSINGNEFELIFSIKVTHLHCLIFIKMLIITNFI